MIKFVKSISLEAAIWTTGLVVLACIDPTHETHFTLCPFYHLGFDFCPGCGLGKSISLFFHGEIIQSIKTHPLGIFAVFILTFRIIKLLQLYHKPYGQNN